METKEDRYCIDQCGRMDTDGKFIIDYEVHPYQYFCKCSPCPTIPGCEEN